MLDDFFSIFGGDDGDDADFDDLNFDEVRSLVERNRINMHEGGRGMTQFSSEVDDSFLRSRYDAMMKRQEENR